MRTTNCRGSRAAEYLGTLAQAGRGALLLLCGSQVAAAQTTSNMGVQREGQWSLAASLYSYFPPDAGNYLQPTLSADRDWLHLEMRYNYEALYATSAWLGYNFSGGDNVEWEFTPMLGGIFGKVHGFAPGYEGSLSWRGFELYSEGEFLIDTADSSASYFYNWSELTVSVLDHWRLGLVTQHTHVYQTDREIQRGVLVGVSYKRAELTGYVFNPDAGTPTVVIALRVSW